MSYVQLSWPDLVAAAVLIVFNGALSWALRLGLERSIAIATLRMVSARRPTITAPKTRRIITVARSAATLPPEMAK